jgi:hypothetical protein
MSLFFRGAVTIATAALFCGGLTAQSTATNPPVTTVIGEGTNTSSAITAFSTEVAVPIVNIGVGGGSLANIGSIPANILAGLTSGALELRQIVHLRPDNRLSVRHILVASGSPNPTPAAAQTMIVDEYMVDVDQVIVSSNPSSVTFIGNIDAITNPGPFGHTRFRPFIYSTGFNSATPTALSGATLSVPGGLNTFVSTGTGTVTLPGGSTPPGGGTGGNQAPVASAGSNVTTVQTEVFLDASGSTDPENGALTYSWRVVSGSANIINPTDAKPRVQLSGNFGSYVFEVTVKDPQGLTSTSQVTVTYTGRF